MVTKFYAAFGIVVLVLYGIGMYAGWEPDSARAEILPASARQSPGGYRSFHFWHSGYSGGK